MKITIICNVVLLPQPQIQSQVQGYFYPIGELFIKFILDKQQEHKIWHDAEITLTHCEIKLFTIGDHFIVNTTHVFLENVEIQAFPNPFENETLIQLKGKDFQNLTFELFDLTGKLIRTEYFEGNEIEVDRVNLNEGLYLFQIKAENQLIGTGKLVIR